MKKKTNKHTTVTRCNATLQRITMRAAMQKRRSHRKMLEGDYGSDHLTVPGKAAHLDSCTADIYLISDSDPTCILGRPTVSALVDQRGGFIYGLAICIGTPKEDNVKEVLANSLADKTKWCAQYGVIIDKEEWPVEFLPSKVIVDRGALSASAIRSFAEAGVAVYSRPPWRGSLEHIIESHFQQMCNQIVNWLPGSASKLRCDVRSVPVDAALTLKQFSQLLISAVLRYHRHERPHFRLTPELIANHVGTCPLELLRWCLANRSAIGVKRDKQL